MIITNQGPQSIGQIARNFEHGNLFLSPDEYQRENAWGEDQKKLLIDTIFRKLDIPKFYLWKIDKKTIEEGYTHDAEIRRYYEEIINKKFMESNETNPYVYEVVDGQQRIRTILEYMGIKPPNKEVYRGRWAKPFSSSQETPVTQGRLYRELNADQQFTFDETSLTVMVLEQANIDEIRDMFLRLQNGTPLTAQQKRDAMGSNLGRLARDLVNNQFFTKAVEFDNRFSYHNLVASQILALELKGKIIGCTSPTLNKLYKDYRVAQIDPAVERKAKNVLKVLNRAFPDRNKRLNRSYALSLYWCLSRVLDFYTIKENDYPKIKNNFEEMDADRLEARSRDFSEPADGVYEDLALSMGRATDGADGISKRHNVLIQFLFKDIEIVPLPNLDARRNFTDEEKLILYKRCNGLCQMEHGGEKCNRQLLFDDATIDHIIPHSKGGSTELNNGRIVYRRCNQARSNKEVFNWKKECIHLKGK